MTEVDRLYDLLKSIDTKVDSIAIQTTKTNGRVTTLEKTVDKHDIVVQSLSDATHYNKGRDYTIYTGLILVGSIVGYVVQHFILKL
jgi:hypothetical protein